MAINKIPPQSVEAEKTLLGCILLDSESLYETISQIKEEDFYYPPHKLVFRSISLLYQKNSSIDILTVSEFLRQSKELEKAGGAGYISKLVDDVPTTKNFISYLNIVKERSLRRKLIDIANDIIAKSYDNGIEIKAIIDSIEKQILDVTEFDYKENFLILKKIILDILEDLEKRIKHQSLYTGIPSGYTALDAITSGFQKGDFVVIAARPSMGKTTFALNIALNMALDFDKTVGFFSLEMPAKTLGYKITSRITNVHFNDIRKGNIPISNMQKLIDAISVIYNKQLVFDDTSSMTLFDIKQKARRLKVKFGLDALFIDYLQLISPPPEIRIENRNQTVSDISRGLKALAKELDIPVIALAQLSRSPEKRDDKRPLLSDIRESGSIEQDADFVAFLYREEYYQKKENQMSQDHNSRTELIIRKHRNGSVGTVNYDFYPSISFFKEITE